MKIMTFLYKAIKNIKPSLMCNARCIAIVVISLFHLTGSDKYLIFCNTPNIPDYYWREYSGVIPYDAVPGGTDRGGFTTYIGQAMVYPYGPLPASIYQGDNTAIASAARKKYSIDKNVKILCSQSLEEFRWIPTDIDKIQLIKNCHLVLGGVDNGFQENIGRVNFNEQIILGKVIRKPLSHDGLWVPDGETETRFMQYEVLAYGCKDNATTKVV